MNKSLLLLVAGISIPLYYYSTTVWFDDTYEAARSEILQKWLQDNDQRLLDFEIDEKNKTLFLSLTGPKPPIWLEDLHTDLQRKVQEEGLEGDFKIKSNWTRSVQISWPPPAKGEVQVGEGEDAHGGCFPPKDDNRDNGVLVYQPCPFRATLLCGHRFVVDAQRR